MALGGRVEEVNGLVQLRIEQFETLGIAPVATKRARMILAGGVAFLGAAKYQEAMQNFCVAYGTPGQLAVSTVHRRTGGTPMNMRGLVTSAVGVALVLSIVLPLTAGAAGEQAAVGSQPKFPTGTSYDALIATLPGLGLLLDTNGDGRLNDEYCDTNGEARVALVAGPYAVIKAGELACNAIPAPGDDVCAAALAIVAVPFQANAIVITQCSLQDGFVDSAQVKAVLPEYQARHCLGARAQSPRLQAGREPSPPPIRRRQGGRSPRPVGVSDRAIRGSRPTLVQSPSQQRQAATEQGRRGSRGSEVPDRPMSIGVGAINSCWAMAFEKLAWR